MEKSQESLKQLSKSPSDKNLEAPFYATLCAVVDKINQHKKEEYLRRKQFYQRQLEYQKQQQEQMYSLQVIQQLSSQDKPQEKKNRVHRFSILQRSFSKERNSEKKQKGSFLLPIATSLPRAQDLIQTPTLRSIAEEPLSKYTTSSHQNSKEAIGMTESCNQQPLYLVTQTDQSSNRGYITIMNEKSSLGRKVKYDYDSQSEIPNAKKTKKKNNKLLPESTLLQYMQSEEFKQMNGIKDKKPLTIEDIQKIIRKESSKRQLESQRILKYIEESRIQRSPVVLPYSKNQYQIHKTINNSFELTTPKYTTKKRVLRSSRQIEDENQLESSSQIQIPYEDRNGYESYTIQTEPGRDIALTPKQGGVITENSEEINYRSRFIRPLYKNPYLSPKLKVAKNYSQKNRVAIDIDIQKDSSQQIQYRKDPYLDALSQSKKLQKLYDPTIRSHNNKSSKASSHLEINKDLEDDEHLPPFAVRSDPKRSSKTQKASGQSSRRQLQMTGPQNKKAFVNSKQIQSPQSMNYSFDQHQNPILQSILNKRASKIQGTKEYLQTMKNFRQLEQGIHQ